MKILHVLLAGGVGGIEKLCLDLGRVDKQSNVFCFIQNKGSIIQQMKEENISTIGLFNEINIKIYNLCRVYKKLNNNINNKEYNAVIFHNGSYFLWLLAIIIKIKYPTLKVFVYAHSNAGDFLHESSKKHFFYKLVYKKMLKKVNGVFAISQTVKESIIYYFRNSKSKIIINYNGIFIDKFYSNNHSVEKPVSLIYVGRLIERKGIQNTLNLLKNVDPSLYHFNIVGDGEYVDELKKLTHLLGIANNVSFLGERNDIDNLLRKSDMFIHLPKWKEGFGITVLEALSTGLICVVNDKGTLPELIENNTNGYIISSELSLNEASTKLNDIIAKVADARLEVMKKNAVSSSQKYSIENTNLTIVKSIRYYN